MSTYRAAIYKAFNEATRAYDNYFFQTYTDDAIESDNRKFITKGQLDFLLALMGEGGGDFGGTAYGDLVNEVADLKEFKENLEDILEEDTDGIINKLKEILDFIANAEIEEGTTLEEFIEQFNKWTINGYSSKTAKQFYAFEDKGTSGQVAVSGANGPTWTNYLTVNRGGTGKTSLGNNKILIGKGTSAIGEINTGPADSVLAGSDTGAPSFKQEITIKKITASDEIYTPSLEAVEAKTDIIRAGRIYELDVTNPSDNVGKEIPAMKNAVAKETMPNEGDFDRNYMVDGLIWIDTSSNISIPESKTYTLSLQCPESTAVANEFVNWTKISIIDELVPEDPAYPSTVNLQLLDIESSDNIHYQLVAYKMRNIDDEEEDTWWQLYLAKGHGGSTAVLWNTYFHKSDEVVIFDDGPLDIIIPNGKVIINNLHLGPRIFKLKTVWSVI